MRDATRQPETIEPTADMDPNAAETGPSKPQLSVVIPLFNLAAIACSIAILYHLRRTNDE